MLAITASRHRTVTKSYLSKTEVKDCYSAISCSTYCNVSLIWMYNIKTWTSSWSKKATTYIHIFTSGKKNQQVFTLSSLSTAVNTSSIIQSKWKQKKCDLNYPSLPPCQSPLMLPALFIDVIRLPKLTFK